MSIKDFKCRCCGACCRIKNGIVRVSDSEIAAVAAYLKMSEAEFIANETELAPDRKSLMLKSYPDGACKYLTADNLCAINDVKPGKCRTFPHEWQNPDSASVCPGLAPTGGAAASVSTEEAQNALCASGWLQERYHCDDGETVARHLSFKTVFDINSFEVGGNHAAEKREYKKRMAAIEVPLDLKSLWRKPVSALSNGEMRRVLLARLILQGVPTIDVGSGTGGLDVEWRAKLALLSGELERLGVKLVLPGCARDARGRPHASPHLNVPKNDNIGKEIVTIRNITVRLGKRLLFDGFSWTIREGERWVLQGENGSGKTTLFALITGDSPLAYACDISVFGFNRGKCAVPMEKIRDKIGVVSSERQAYLGLSPQKQLDLALKARTRLLLLDEPCCNLTHAEAVQFASKVSAWLDSHPRAAAIWIEHSSDMLPASFDRLRVLAPRPREPSRET